MPTKACKQKVCLDQLSILCILTQILPRARSNTILDFTFYCPAHGVHACVAAKGLKTDVCKPAITDCNSQYQHPAQKMIITPHSTLTQELSHPKPNSVTNSAQADWLK